MDNIQEKGNATPTPEEDKHEEEALQEVKEDEVRNKIIEDYELDEDEQSDLINKLTQKEVEQRKAFGKVIEQKRKWRDQANKQPEKEPKPTPSQGEDVRAIIREEFNQKYIEDLQYPDEVKEEIKLIVKNTGKDVKEVANDPYILYKKEEVEREAKNTDASPSGTRKGGTVIDKDNPPKFDLSTEEGMAEFKKWEKKLIAKS